jgi:hypothetical protein
MIDKINNLMKTMKQFLHYANINMLFIVISREKCCIHRFYFELSICVSRVYEKLIIE